MEVEPYPYTTHSCGSWGLSELTLLLDAAAALGVLGLQTESPLHSYWYVANAVGTHKLPQER